MEITLITTENKNFSMSKAQADIISSVLIVIISLSLVASAYTWGMYLIEKRQSTTIVERVEKYFDRSNPSSIASRIEDVAVSGAEVVFNLDVDGIWVLNPCSDSAISSGCTGNDDRNNTIMFVFNTKATNVKPGAGWVPDICGGIIGLLGKDAPSVVCKRSDAAGDSYNITYKLWLRELDDSLSNPTTGIKYLLVPAQPSLCKTTYCISTGKSVKLSKGSMIQTSVN
jgi:hypothetical protein